MCGWAQPHCTMGAATPLPSPYPLAAVDWRLPPAISTLSSLRSPAVSRMQMEGDGSWQHLALLTGLTWLHLDCCGADGSGQQALAFLPALPQLGRLEAERVRAGKRAGQRCTADGVD